MRPGIRQVGDAATPARADRRRAQTARGRGSGGRRSRRPDETGVVPRSGRRGQRGRATGPVDAVFDRREDARHGPIRRGDGKGLHPAGGRQDARGPGGGPRGAARRRRARPATVPRAAVAPELATGLRREEQGLRALRRRPRGLPDQRHVGARPPPPRLAADEPQVGPQPAGRARDGLPARLRQGGDVRGIRPVQLARLRQRPLAGRPAAAALDVRRRGRPVGPASRLAGQGQPRGGPAGGMRVLRLPRPVLQPAGDGRRRRRPNRLGRACLAMAEIQELHVEAQAGRYTGRRRRAGQAGGRGRHAPLPHGPVPRFVLRGARRPRPHGPVGPAGQPLGQVPAGAAERGLRVPPARLGHGGVGFGPRADPAVGRRALRPLGQLRDSLFTPLESDGRGLRRRRAVRRQRQRRVRLVTARPRVGRRAFVQHLRLRPPHRFDDLGAGLLLRPGPDGLAASRAGGSALPVRLVGHSPGDHSPRRRGVGPGGQDGPHQPVAL